MSCYVFQIFVNTICWFSKSIWSDFHRNRTWCEKASDFAVWIFSTLFRFLACFLLTSSHWTCCFSRCLFSRSDLFTVGFPNPFVVLSWSIFCLVSEISFKNKIVSGLVLFFFWIGDFSFHGMQSIAVRENKCFQVRFKDLITNY